MITLTFSAANKFKEQLRERGKGLGIRLAVAGSGCSGYSYVVNFADTVNDDDIIFEDQGVKLFVDSDSLQYVDGTEIDFEKKNLTEALKFRNPKVKGECGCGESFTI